MSIDSNPIFIEVLVVSDVASKDPVHRSIYVARQLTAARSQAVCHLAHALAADTSQVTL